MGLSFLKLYRSQSYSIFEKSYTCITVKLLTDLYYVLHKFRLYIVKFLKVRTSVQVSQLGKAGNNGKPLRI